jgi:hypothetical protein
MQPIGKLALAHGSGGNGHHHLIVRSLRGDGFQAVEQQKGQHCHTSSPFIAIEKRLILGEVKAIGRCHLKDAGMQELPVKLRSGQRQGRRQQPRIGQAIRAAAG